MTAAYGTKLIYEALGRVCADVTSVKVVQGVNVGTAESPYVVPMSDELADTPAIVLVPGPWSIIAGSWRRDTHTAQGTIFVPREAPGDGLVTLLDIWDELTVAFAARSKAYEAEPALQSVLMTEGPGLQSAEWPIDSERWYLTWPFELEVKVNVAAVYQAQ